MPKNNVVLNRFNRGMVSQLALARVELDNIPFSAEVMTNWRPRILGSMMLRPGFGFLDSTKSNNKAVHIPFVFSNSDTAIIEITDLFARFRVSEVAIVRPSVSTVVSNGNFSSATNWSDDDEAGATSTISGGVLTLVGNGTKAAIRTQTLTISSPDQNVEHALRILVTRGLVTFRLGSASGGDEYITETTLGVGTHSLAFTPTGGSAYIKLSSLDKAGSIVDDINIEAAGVMSLPTPWVEADLGLIRYDQSADVVFIACGKTTNTTGYQQRKIERRGTRSWSIVLYEPNDGPFRIQNVGPITIVPTAISGDTTLTASQPLFKSTNVGGLYKISSVGQVVSVVVTAQNQFSSSIQVTGVGTNRDISVVRTGTFVANVVVQRSSDNASWITVQTYTTASTDTYNDALDNQIQYYRIGVATGGYTSGTATCSLNYSSGSIDGICRVTAFTSSVSVDVAVLKDFGGTTASADWSEGDWSDRRGYPSSVALYDGRLMWAGKNKVWGSVSDAFSSFDSATVGDSGPISRSIGQGPVDTINWLLPLGKLVIGAQGAEWSVKATTIDEPITPTNFNVKSTSTQGSAAVAAAKIDTTGVFIQKSGAKLYEVLEDTSTYNSSFVTNDLTKLIPEIAGTGSFVRIAVQRQLDTMVHCVRADGKVAVMVNDPSEKIICWYLVETDGVVEDAFILPGNVEDKVYYCVKRTINGSTKRYLERWALESECQGDTLNKQCDSFITYSGVSTASMSGLSHLENKTVSVWGNNKNLGTYVVTSGAITLSEAVTNAVIGLQYTAQFKSSKLAYAAAGGTALMQRKRVNQIGVILYNTYYQGLQYGPDFDTLDDLPLVSEGQIQSANTLYATFDQDFFVFNGGYDTDSRICLQAQSPNPCTILALGLQIQTNDKG